MLKRFELYELVFPNGKRYIGITCRGTLNRWKAHKRCAEQRDKSRLYTAMNKYGSENISVRTLVVGDQDYIKNLEILAIAQYQTHDKAFGYNSTLGGDGTFGVEISDIRKAKLSAKSLALWQTQEYRDKVLSKTPVNYTPELRSRISENTRKQHADPEKSARIRAAIKAKWADVGWRTEQIRKLTESKTPETYKKIAEKARFSEAARAASREYWSNADNREKNRLRVLGTKRSPETIAKIKSARAKQIITQEQKDKTKFSHIMRKSSKLWRAEQREFMENCRATYKWASILSKCADD